MTDSRLKLFFTTLPERIIASYTFDILVALFAFVFLLKIGACKIVQFKFQEFWIANILYIIKLPAHFLKKAFTKEKSFQFYNLFGSLSISRKHMSQQSKEQQSKTRKWKSSEQ